MGMYDDLLTEIQPGGKLEKFERIEQSIISKLKSTYPNLPKDYLVFLSEIGFGELGNSEYLIFNSVLTSDEIYDDETAESLSHILIFGDDMQGSCSGFDTNNEWIIVEVDSTIISYNKIFNTFSDFIREKLKYT